MHKIAFICLGFFFLSDISVLSGCSAHSAYFKAPVPSPGLSQEVISSDPLSDTQIRKVDFENFTYPWTKDLVGADRLSQKAFTLRNGELPATRDKDGFIHKMGIHLVGVKYGDANGDKLEDAIVVLSFQTGGSALPNAVYIYTWRGERPAILWSFSTGDRADGGLRDVYIENGNLVVEKYSPVDKKGDCCPMFFNRVRYVWQDKQFQLNGKEEPLPNPGKNASLRFTPGRRG